MARTTHRPRRQRERREDRGARGRRQGTGRRCAQGCMARAELCRSSQVQHSAAHRTRSSSPPDTAVGKVQHETSFQAVPLAGSYCCEHQRWDRARPRHSSGLFSGGPASTAANVRAQQRLLRVSHRRRQTELQSRSNQLQSGITTRLRAAKTTPTGECCEPRRPCSNTTRANAAGSRQVVRAAPVLCLIPTPVRDAQPCFHCQRRHD